MCGIVSAVSHRNVVPILLHGLQRLEYRGYDSAGVAVVNGCLKRLRSTGRVAELARLAHTEGLNGQVGIAHTRWATHGAPSERNAHPHVSGGVSVVHNGIIENYDEMRSFLARRGYEFVSDTDTEVIAHLVHWERAGPRDLLAAVRRAVTQLHGAYAIAVIADDAPDEVVVAKMGAPLLIGVCPGETLAASDTSALVEVTRRIVFLEDGDCAQLSRDGIVLLDRQGRRIERPVRLTELVSRDVELRGYRHYMQKEIWEQPAAVRKTLEAVQNAHSVTPHLFGPDAEAVLPDVDSVCILGCGTSFHAGMVARYWMESVAGVRCNVEIASEYRYRVSVANARTLIVAVSQSGETADTLAALKHAQDTGHPRTLAICNVPDSALVRQSPLRFLTRAGPEIGVASTKAFTTQLAALMLLTIVLAKLRGRLPRDAEERLLLALRDLPGVMERALELEPQVAAWGRAIAGSEHALFLARGMHYPIAMEGALKLKEISYIHAEAYAAGELKHGPLALVDHDMPVLAIAPANALWQKLKSNLQEVRARGGELYVLADEDVDVCDEAGVRVIRMPGDAGLLSPVAHTVPLQLLAYHAAVRRGNDVDKPRNLAKSVTVE
ncbi:MAG: glutamine--fructose-6-phosphate transaminase (isomerizing) [Rhodospirillaceae bacterium]